MCDAWDTPATHTREDVIHAAMIRSGMCAARGLSESQACHPPGCEPSLLAAGVPAGVSPAPRVAREPGGLLPYPFTADHAELVSLASIALLAQQPVRMLLPDGWERPRNFPLPISACDSNAREYRPIAILEWVNDELSGANRASAARDRAKRAAA